MKPFAAKMSGMDIKVFDFVVVDEDVMAVYAPAYGGSLAAAFLQTIDWTPPPPTVGNPACD